MSAHAFDSHALDEASVLAELAFVRRLAKSLLADENDADDVVQDAWLRARTSPSARGREPGGLRSWLAAVTGRLARDSGRSRARRARREERAARAEALPSTLDVVERSAHLESLVRAVHELAEPGRSVILWRYLDGRSNADLARASGISEDAVRKRLSRARAELRRRLARELGGDPRRALLAILGAAGPLPGAGEAASASAAAAGGAVSLASVKAAALCGAALAIAAAVPVAVALQEPSPGDGRAPSSSAPLAVPTLESAGLGAGPSTGGLSGAPVRAEAASSPSALIDTDVVRGVRSDPRPDAGAEPGTVRDFLFLEVRCRSPA